MSRQHVLRTGIKFVTSSSHSGSCWTGSRKLILVAHLDTRKKVIMNSSKDQVGEANVPWEE